MSSNEIFDKILKGISNPLAGQYLRLYFTGSAAQHHMWAPDPENVPYGDGTDLLPKLHRGMRFGHTHPWNVKNSVVTKILDVKVDKFGITVVAKLSEQHEQMKFKFEHYHIWVVAGAEERLYEYFSKMCPIKVQRLRNGRMGPFLDKVLSYVPKASSHNKAS